MEMTILYRKNFSALEHLQAPKNVIYYLTQENIRNECFYGFCIQENEEGQSTRCEMSPFSRTKSQVESLLTYLYENAVPAVHCRSVIADAGFASMENRSNTYGTAEYPAFDCR